MKVKRWITVAFAAAAVFLLCGCREANSPSPPVPSAYQEVEWVIAADGEGIAETLNEYSIYADMLAKMKLRVRFTVWSADREVLISRAIVSGDLPDFATFYLDDTVGNRFEGMGVTVDVRSFSESLYQSIPETVREYHLKRGKTDKLSYIPGGYGGTVTASEGMFVRRSVANSGLLKEAADASAFIHGVAEICRQYREKNNRTNDVGAVMLDNEPYGWQVLEHLFGVDDPVAADSADLLPIVSFLSDLGRVENGFYKDSFLSQRLIDNGIEDSCRLFIGRSQVIHAYNRQNPDDPFVPMTPLLSQKGYLDSDTEIGRYKTYILNPSVSQAAIELAEYLHSEQGSYLAVLGQKDVHWVMDGDTPTVFLSVKENMADAAYRRRTGIGCFTYFSRYGIDFPEETSSPSVVLRTVPANVRNYDERLYYGTRLSQIHAAYQEAFSIGGSQGYLTAKSHLF